MPYMRPNAAVGVSSNSPYLLSTSEWTFVTVSMNIILSRPNTSSPFHHRELFASMFAAALLFILSIFEPMADAKVLKSTILWQSVLISISCLLIFSILTKSVLFLIMMMHLLRSTSDTSIGNFTTWPSNTLCQYFSKMRCWRNKTSRHLSRNGEVEIKEKMFNTLICKYFFFRYKLVFSRSPYFQWGWSSVLK